MQRRRSSVVAVMSSIVAMVTVGLLTVGGGTAAAPGGRVATERDGAKGGASEADEQGQLAQQRLEAWRSAKAAAPSALPPSHRRLHPAGPASR